MNFLQLGLSQGKVVQIKIEKTHGESPHVIYLVNLFIQVFRQERVFVQSLKCLCGRCRIVAPELEVRTRRRKREFPYTFSTLWGLLFPILGP